MRYEDLWVALANTFRSKVEFLLHFVLNSPIHVDRYRFELYQSIKSGDVWEWGPFLGGHVDLGQKKAGVADHIYDGQLTEDPNTILHSCESRGACPVRDSANVIQIIPVTSDRAPKKDYMLESTAFKSTDVGDASKRRKTSYDISDRPNKVIPNGALREPGHSLLEPRESWWVHHGAKERPPIYSSDGLILPYYLVPSCMSSSHRSRLYHYPAILH